MGTLCRKELGLRLVCRSNIPPKEKLLNNVKNSTCLQKRARNSNNNKWLKFPFLIEGPWVSGWIDAERTTPHPLLDDDFKPWEFVSPKDKAQPAASEGASEKGDKVPKKPKRKHHSEKGASSKGESSAAKKAKKSSLPSQEATESIISQVVSSQKRQTITKAFVAKKPRKQQTINQEENQSTQEQIQDQPSVKPSSSNIIEPEQSIQQPIQPEPQIISPTDLEGVRDLGKNSPLLSEKSPARDLFGRNPSRGKGLLQAIILRGALGLPVILKPVWT